MLPISEATWESLVTACKKLKLELTGAICLGAIPNPKGSTQEQHGRIKNTWVTRSCGNNMRDLRNGVGVTT